MSGICRVCITRTFSKHNKLIFKILKSGALHAEKQLELANALSQNL